MRIPCPNCGTRDRREFTFQGDAIALDRPAPDAPDALWDLYVNPPKSPPGPVLDLWYHAPCGTWAVVHRDTANRNVISAKSAREADT